MRIKVGVTIRQGEWGRKTGTQDPNPEGFWVDKTLRGTRGPFSAYSSSSFFLTRAEALDYASGVVKGVERIGVRYYDDPEIV